jgi:site-specific DNA-methyltransferase (adenine-specific)
VDFDKVQRQQADGSGNTINNAFGASALVGTEIKTYKENGRFPANFIHDGSDEVLALLGEPARFFYCAKASKRDRNEGLDGFEDVATHRYGAGIGEGLTPDAPSIGKNHHPTVKPTDLMRYLVRLITPPNGTVLDPFMGSGSTGKACAYEGFDFIGIDMTPEYVEIARARIAFAEREMEGKLL